MLGSEPRNVKAGETPIWDRFRLSEIRCKTFPEQPNKFFFMFSFLLECGNSVSKPSLGGDGDDGHRLCC